MSQNWLRGWAVLAFLALCGMACPCMAQDDDEDEEPLLLPSLRAEYFNATGLAFAQRDASAQYQAGQTSADPRLTGEPARIEWQGRLWTITQGAYRLSAHVRGELKISLDGNLILAASRDEPDWVESEPVELSYGYHPIRVTFIPAGEQSRLGLYWSGPQFALEPIPPRHFFHDPDQAPDERFAQGRRLSRAMRCAACHDLPEAAPLAAPALDRLPGNLRREWLLAWLGQPMPAGVSPPNTADNGPPPGARFDSPLATHDSPPDIGGEYPSGPRHCAASAGLAPDEAQALTDYLLPGSDATQAEAPASGDAATGKTLFLTLGCLACHQLDQLGAPGLLTGGDLTHVGRKRPADFFARWLADPGKINAAHRMPVYQLTEPERLDLAAWLSTLDPPVSPPSANAHRPATNASSTAGRELARRYRCGACHTLPDKDERPLVARRSPIPEADGAAGCLGAADRTAARPGYQVSESDADALRTYLAQIDDSPVADLRQSAPRGDQLMEEHNCLACHARDLAPGLAAGLDRVVAAQPELAPLLPALAPPSLTGVGDKLLDEALTAAISRQAPPRRPWLLARMPRFNLPPAQLAAISQHLIASDRIADRETRDDPSDPVALALAGGRLVTSDGFGCTSCHQLGGSIPRDVQLAAHGSDLTMIGARVRRPWYDRWVRNPARIVPRMEMPSIERPVRGVLHDRLDEQLAAVWSVLNQPGFNPPQPNPIRTVRARGLPGLAEPALALTDVMEVNEQPFVRPLVIGLTNRHSGLFDLERNRLAGWWIGDVARQRTRGKSWYWEAGGVQALSPPPVPDGASELAIQRDGQPLELQSFGQCLAALDGWRNEADGLRFEYRLRVASANAAESTILRASQAFRPLQASETPAGRSGFRRRLELRGLPAGSEVAWRLAPEGEFSPTADGNAVEAPSLGAPRVALVAADSSIRLEASAPTALLTASADNARASAEENDSPAVVCEVDYTTELPLDQFPIEPPAAELTPPTPLDVSPGWQALRLPLPISEMPTGLAWRADGALVFCSLKGSVWLAHDTDGDGIEDQQRLFCDGLAAPYGVATHGDAIDAINKFGLLRLVDRDGDGQADRATIAADGWGYTADYHDWAVGLPNDAAGAYYVGLPCQQDDRGAAAARLRGTVQKLTPREPTAGDPRLFTMQTVAAGLRFPMGLAFNAAGELFATDNQGNYNPFNELNHLQAETRYGFINKLEASPNFHPPFQSPAIDIPHPWTRSINGICCLLSPASAAGAGFGPFEGHLLGCEYDTRRLIRMSLQAVGDTYQGAAYPYSIPPEEDAEPLEGPVVCAVSPAGDVYVGNLRDSGWGGGQNTGSLVRLRPTGTWPLGIAEARASVDGFVLDFTGPVSPAGGDASNYSILSYRRESTPAYGGPDLDSADERVERVELSSDRRRARLTLSRMRPGFVYEIRVRGLAPAGQAFFPAEAYFTLRQIPE